MNWDVGVEVSSRLTFRPKFLAFPRAACVGKVKCQFQMTYSFVLTPAPPTMKQPIRFIYLKPTSSERFSDRAMFSKACPETPFFSK
jgi:hypothetical protein